MNFLEKLAIPAAISIVLTACGGGDSDSATQLEDNVARVSFGGVAAIGAPLANSNITATCAAGEAKTSADSNGSYTFSDIQVELPCLITAQGSASQSSLTTYGLASEPDSNVNATTFTTLVLQHALGVNTLEGVTRSTLQGLRGRNMVQILEASWNALADDLTTRYSNNIFKTINPFSSFVPDPNVSDVDAALEIIHDLTGKTIDELYKSTSYALKVGMDEEERTACADTSQFEMGKCWRVTMGETNGYAWVNMQRNEQGEGSTDEANFNVYGKDFNFFKNEYEVDGALQTNWVVTTSGGSEAFQSWSMMIEKMTVQHCLVENGDATKAEQTLNMVSPNARMLSQASWTNAVKKPNGINLFFQQKCQTYGGDASKNWTHADLAYMEFTADGTGKFHTKQSGQENTISFTKKQIDDWLFNGAELEMLGEKWMVNPYYMTVTEDGETFDVFAMQLYKKITTGGSMQIDSAFLVEGEGVYLDL